MKNINILNKGGMLSNEDRKEKLVHNCSSVSFESCLDLSEPIKVRSFGNTNQISINQYSRDIASFIVFWKEFVMEDLNGFSGFNNVKFELVGFTLI